MTDKKPTAGENPYLLVDPVVQPIMDHVIVGFLIMQRIVERRKAKRTAERTSADGGGSLESGESGGL